MKDKKIPNIQRESDRLKIKRNISDSEDKKAKILLEMGMKVYSKIRKGELIDLDLADMCEEIKNIDIDIYTEYMKLRNLDEDSNRVICECGYTAYKNEKFCPQCGKSLIPEEKQYVICDNCQAKNDIDSNYCGCCGHKIKVEFTSSYNDDYHTNIEEEVIYDVELDKDNEEEYKEEKVIEVEGREFLKDQQVKDNKNI